MKLLTLATEKEADEQSAAIFQRYAGDVRAAAGLGPDDEIDRKPNGDPLPPGRPRTTRYASPPAPVYDLEANGLPKRDQNGNPIVLVASDPKALVIDAYVETLQGATVEIPGGKQVTIDVSAAVPYDPATGVASAEFALAEEIKP